MKTPETTMVLTARRSTPEDQWYLDWTFKNIVEEGLNLIVLDQVVLNEHVCPLWETDQFNEIAVTSERERKSKEYSALIGRLEEINKEQKELKTQLTNLREH